MGFFRFWFGALISVGFGSGRFRVLWDGTRSRTLYIELGFVECTYRVYFTLPEVHSI